MQDKSPRIFSTFVDGTLRDFWILYNHDQGQVGENRPGKPLVLDLAEDKFTPWNREETFSEVLSFFKIPKGSPAFDWLVVCWRTIAAARMRTFKMATKKGRK